MISLVGIQVSFGMSARALDGVAMYSIVGDPDRLP